MNAETSLRWLSRAEPNLAKVRQLAGRIADSARLASEIVQRIRGHGRAAAPRAGARSISTPWSRKRCSSSATTWDARDRPVAGASTPNLPRVLGDRVQLQQVMVNLLVNGLQAATQARRNGRAHRTCQRPSTAAACASRFAIPVPVSPPENLDRVFDGFFTTKEDGMGIGLAICQSIIAAHGGAITAANHPQGGAVFRFALPRRRADGAGPPGAGTVSCAGTRADRH